MREDTMVHSLQCPTSQQMELVELRVSRLPVLQLRGPAVVSCSHLERAQDCARCFQEEPLAT